MNCSKCDQDLPECEIQLSHDIPKYMGGTDSDGRHYLCKSCHDIYEYKILFDCIRSLGIEIDDSKRPSYYMSIIKNYDNVTKIKCIMIAKKIRGEFFNVK